MPTATSVSDYRLVNIGPLTTTFTAPASCSTAAYNTAIAFASAPLAVIWNANCTWAAPADCAPNESAVQSFFSSRSGDDNPANSMAITYNSPGLACPIGWSTIGAAARINPTSISTSGAFNQDRFIATGSHAQFFEPGLDALVAALDPGETAHLCCPSSYEARAGVCYSNIPTSSFTPTVGCRMILPNQDLATESSGTFTFGTQTFTGNLLEVTGTTPLSTQTTSLPTPSAYIGVAVQYMYRLIHQSSDLTAASTDSTASGTPISSPTGTDKPSSAVRVRGSEYGLGVVAACSLSFVLGALLIV